MKKAIGMIKFNAKAHGAYRDVLYDRFDRKIPKWVLTIMFIICIPLDVLIVGIGFIMNRKAVIRLIEKQEEEVLYSLYIKERNLEDTKLNKAMFSMVTKELKEEEA